MTTPGDQAEARPTTKSPTAMRRLLSADMVERSGCPFDPPPGLQQRRGQGPVQPLKLLNGAPSWLVTGLDETRAVLSDSRFSSDRVRHPGATQPQPGEAEQMAAGGAAVAAQAVESRPDGMFVFMDPPERDAHLRGAFPARNVGMTGPL